MRSGSGGFTLFEVLAVVLLTGIVLGITLDFYVDLSRAGTRAGERTREIRRSVAVLDRVARDFESAVMIAKPPERDPLAHPWFFIAESRYAEGAADHIKFVTRGNDPSRSSGHASDIAVVAYHVSRADDDTLELWRWSTPRLPRIVDPDFPTPEDEGSLLLAEGLSSFGVTLISDSGDSMDRWDSTQLTEAGALPRMVEIRVGLAGPAYAATEEGSSRIFARHVPLPLRPIDLQRLLAGEPTGEGGEEGEETDGLTLGDCIVQGRIDASDPAAQPWLELLVENASRPWSNMRQLVLGQAPVDLIRPECR